MDSENSSLLALINHCIETQENLGEYLLKAEALAQVAVTLEFLELSEEVTYNYLWLLGDLISEARRINEHLQGALLKHRPMELKSKTCANVARKREYHENPKEKKIK